MYRVDAMAIPTSPEIGNGDVGLINARSPQGKHANHSGEVIHVGLGPLGEPAGPAGPIVLSPASPAGGVSGDGAPGPGSPIDGSGPIERDAAGSIPGTERAERPPARRTEPAAASRPGLADCLADGLPPDGGAELEGAPPPIR